MKQFATADYHLGEDRFEIMGRPFKTQMEMIDCLISNHNAIVNKDDLVYVIGDVCYQKYPEFLPHIAKFNGRKVLIRGNHDRNISDAIFSNYFEQIVSEGGGVSLDVCGISCYLTHYPTCGVKDKFNIVGHVHAAFKYQLNMLNVGVDVHHFRPVDLDTIPFHLKAITEFYDEDVWVAYHEINFSYVKERGKKSSYFTNI